MNIMKYLLSKSYRDSSGAEYTKEICDKLFIEQEQKHEIYEGIFGNKTDM